MFKGFIILIVIVMIGGGCKQKYQNKYTELIAKFISAIELNDTIQVYQLIDTIAYFNVQDKEALWLQVTYLKNRFKECGTKIREGKILIRDVPVNSKEYILPYCRGAKGEVVFDSFDLVLSIPEYGTGEKIRYFDVIKYRNNNTPTIAPPSNL